LKNWFLECGQFCSHYFFYYQLLNFQPNPPMYLAAREGHKEVVEYLLNAGATPTTLHDAVLGGHIEVV
jgi:ankyrin repeat protein